MCGELLRRSSDCSLLMNFTDVVGRPSKKQKV